MASDEGQSARRFSRAVRETLDAVVAPMVRDALIHDALALAGLSALPEDGQAIRAFARGSLRSVTEQAIGVELAQSVMDEILITIQPTASEEHADDERAPASRRPIGVAATLPPPAPTLRRTMPPGFTAGETRASSPPLGPHRGFTPVPARRRSTPKASALELPAWPTGFNSHIRPQQADEDSPPSGMTRGASATPAPRIRATPIEAPFVLVSTEDAGLFQTLSEWFGNRARVCRVKTPTELVRLLDGTQGIRAIVILDGKSPSIRPAALVALLEDLPEVEVVLCRAAAAIEDVILSASAATERWLVYREPASLDHVAAECLRLVS